MKKDVERYGYTPTYETSEPCEAVEVVDVAEIWNLVSLESYIT